eukprot:CAMPEP_0181291014 /NCGR_PEP_ID=MMETSP1101-20121128/1728_1 /TAXON_ID=46948 /ORGANISM="Rhodomonas abbreviata, Strain Caron Lab Isolate" /LENGTH=225 /DNA_ID=CAMNT_0023395351 /DNA_START=181 /DNA_END=855 /DNA_ORIENTATION=-
MDPFEEHGFSFDNHPLSFEQFYDMFAIRRTVCQMLQDRGYILSAEDSTELTQQSFHGRFNEKEHKTLTILAEMAVDDEQKIMVFFPVAAADAKTKKVSVDAVKEIIKLMKKESVNRAIIVVEKPLLGHSQLVLEQETEQQQLKDNPSWRVETFLNGELKVNITRHELVPRHEVLSEDEKKGLLRRYHLQEKHLPRIQKSDPIARYYGLDRKTVIKIVRPSETAGW